MSALVPSPRTLFLREIEKPEEELDLGRAALLVAKEEHPQLPVERYTTRLDVLAEEVRGRLSGETAPPVVLRELVEVLYTRWGLKGNREHYYDHRNSFLNEVLDRGLGIPLTLGIVVMEVGRRLELTLEAVNFPGHFMVRQPGESVDLLVDPFDGGRILFEDQAQELLDRIYGGMVRVQPGFLQAVGPREVLARLLRNLRGIYMNDEEVPRAVAVLERLLLLDPGAPMELRDLGTLLARMGRTAEAVEPLERYLEVASDSGDARRIRSLLERLRRMEGARAEDDAGRDDEGG